MIDLLYGAGESASSFTPQKSQPESLERRSRKHRGRKVRSRSSPVRCAPVTSSNAQLRNRSPSTSPPQFSAVLPNSLHDDSTFPYNNNACHGGAYFSSRPPLEPMRLVPVANPASPPPRLPKPPAITYSRNVGRVELSLEQPINTEKQKECKESHMAVWRLLCELIQEIPSSHIITPCKLSSCSDCSIEANAEISSEQHNPAVEALDAAVQAIIPGTNDGGGPQIDDYTSHSSTECDASVDWVCGARALRDSHVRHVLRQLKHIHRLNRALDRASTGHTHLRLSADDAQPLKTP